MSELTKHEPATIYIKPSTGFTALNLRDLWLYRELVLFMVWRDIKVRYKQTLLGAAWAILQPVLTMLAMFFLFSKVAKLPTDNIPYPIFSYTALLPWGLFVAALNQGSRSLTSNHNMITKVYFPKLILPLASVIAGLVDFAIASVILVGLMMYYCMESRMGAALVSVVGDCCCIGCSVMAFRDQRQISRCQLCSPLPHPILVFRHAGCLFGEGNF